MSDSHTHSDTQEHTPLTCPACRAIDLVDGIEDGQIFTPEHFPIPQENRLVSHLKSGQDRAADSVTQFAGSLNFVYIHGVWFAVWIMLNIGLFGTALKFDAYPFGLLTMIVSLEAIFLSTFVMVSQNRQAARAKLRADLDFEANLRSEIWSVHIGERLGIDPEHVESVVQRALVATRDD
jgi:uncharacterized membrane protein